MRGGGARPAERAAPRRTTSEKAALLFGHSRHRHGKRRGAEGFYEARMLGVEVADAVNYARIALLGFARELFHGFRRNLFGFLRRYLAASQKTAELAESSHTAAALLKRSG